MTLIAALRGWRLEHADQWHHTSGAVVALLAVDECPVLREYEDEHSHGRIVGQAPRAWVAWGPNDHNHYCGIYDTREQAMSAALEGTRP